MMVEASEDLKSKYQKMPLDLYFDKKITVKELDQSTVKAVWDRLSKQYNIEDRPSIEVLLCKSFRDYRKLLRKISIIANNDKRNEYPAIKAKGFTIRYDDGSWEVLIIDDTMGPRNLYKELLHIVEFYKGLPQGTLSNRY